MLPGSPKSETTRFIQQVKEIVLKLTEYQAKKLFSLYNISVPQGQIAVTTNQALLSAEEIGYPVALKAQVTVGGRGKAGGVVIAADEKEARETIPKILGSKLTTAQTGEHGCMVEQILVEKAHPLQKELYLALTVDRDQGRIVIMASACGGIEIEQATNNNPEHLCTIFINPLIGVRPHHLRRLRYHLALSDELTPSFSKLLTQLYKLMTENDLLMVEINPLALLDNGNLMALDAKIEIDDNALYRFSHQEIFDSQQASGGINYIQLNGFVGTMANGAGLAMATIDMVNQLGFQAANFLDVGGGADDKTIEKCLEMVVANPEVKLIFINIFGGILRCDLFAAAVVNAARKLNITMPVVVRMEGANKEEGIRILEKSSLSITFVADLTAAASQLTQMAAKS